MTRNPPDSEPPTPRSGIDIAREALAAAKAEATRRGMAVVGASSASGTSRGAGSRRTGSSTGSSAGSSPDRTSWRARRAGADTRSGAHPDERDPQLLSTSLDRLLAERGWATDVAIGGVMGRWAAIVGPALAEHCEPVSYDVGKLVVQAESTAWATQLRLLAPNLVRRLNEELGQQTVTFVQVLGPRPPSWKRGLRSVRGRGARDTYG